MKNVELFRHQFKEPLSGFEFSDDSINLGGLKIYAHHDQDCCENVYADFSAFKYYQDEIKRLGDFDEISVSAVPNMGFVLFIYQKTDWGEKSRVGVFVPCFNEQNGYYSDDLDLLITSDKTTFKIDLNDCVCDRIY